VAAGAARADWLKKTTQALNAAALSQKRGIVIVDTLNLM
jgi:hypothetical protein